MEETFALCRREITLPAGGSRLCCKTIEKKNALNWCGDCRAERLPMWPADDVPPMPGDLPDRKQQLMLEGPR